MPVLARSSVVLVREQAAQARRTPLIYFECYIKARGGGLQPATPPTISVGLAELEGSRYLHYHSSGRKYSSFPRPSTRSGRPCGPAYNVGDTIGCGWLHSGELFFTRTQIAPRSGPRARAKTLDRARPLNPSLP